MVEALQTNCNQQVAFSARDVSEHQNVPNSGRAVARRPGYREDGLPESLGGFETEREYRKYLRTQVLGMAK